MCRTQRSLFFGPFRTKIQSEKCFETVSTPGLLLDAFFPRPLSLLYWISLNCQVPWGWHCIFRWICLQNAKMDFFPTVLIAFPKTDLDFTDCCMNLFSTMTMFMFLCKYDRPSIILFVVFPSPLKRRSTQSSSCLIFAI